MPRTAALANAAMGSLPLYSLNITATPNGFSSSARGWNSFGLQANGGTDPGFVFNQYYVQQQCDVLASSVFKNFGYTYCSLDSGWSVSSYQC